MNDDLLESAQKAIDQLFGDTSVSKEKALENLEELSSDIESKMDCLKEEIRREASE